MKKILSLLSLIVVCVALVGCGMFCGEKTEPVTPTPVKEELTCVVYRTPADGEEQLIAETVKVYGFKKELPQLALNALLTTKPAKADLQNIFPSGVKVKNLSVNDGLATVDLSKEIYDISGGSYDEMMLTSAIVNTLTEFNEIKKVQILIEGEKTATIKGHIDLMDTFERDTEIIAK